MALSSTGPEIRALLERATSDRDFGSEIADKLKQVDQSHRGDFQRARQTISFNNYFKLVTQLPQLADSAPRYLGRAIKSYGVDKTDPSSPKYELLRDPFNGGQDRLIGLDHAVGKLVDSLSENNRITLIVGPNGTGKSTLVRLFKEAVEGYSRTDEGALFNLVIKDSDQAEGKSVYVGHESPLTAIPVELRADYHATLNEDQYGAGNDAPKSKRPTIQIHGDCTPQARRIIKKLVKDSNDNFEDVRSKLFAQRRILSAADCNGVVVAPLNSVPNGAVKNGGRGASSELTTQFTQTFARAEGGIVELPEFAALGNSVLSIVYNATDGEINTPKGTRKVNVVMIGHMTQEQYDSFVKNNPNMVARINKIAVGYCTDVRDEVELLRTKLPKDSTKHIAPLTIDTMAVFSVLTRLFAPKHASLSYMQKLKLYMRQQFVGFTADNVRELRDQFPDEGLYGVQPRHMQDMLTTLEQKPETWFGPLDVIKALQVQIDKNEPFKEVGGAPSEAKLLPKKTVLDETKAWLNEKIERQIREAWYGLVSEIFPKAAEYLLHCKAYSQREKIKNKYTKAYEEPDEMIMRAVEEHLDIPEGRKDDFRREVFSLIGALSTEGFADGLSIAMTKPHDPSAVKALDLLFSRHGRLREGIFKVLTADSVTSVPPLGKLYTFVKEKRVGDKGDPVQKLKEDVLDNLVNMFGYNEISALETLQYYAGVALALIFPRFSGHNYTRV